MFLVLTSTEIKISRDLENGIEFSCQMCGKCCRGFDEGEVYLYKEDILRLTEFLNIKGKKNSFTTHPRICCLIFLILTFFHSHKITIPKCQ